LAGQINPPGRGAQGEKLEGWHKKGPEMGFLGPQRCGKGKEGGQRSEPFGKDLGRGTM